MLAFYHCIVRDALLVNVFLEYNNDYYCENVK